MSWTHQRAAMQAILRGNVCIRPGSVYDPISARIAADLGFELGMLGGSTASLTVLGDPDLILISLSELAETVRRIARAANLPVLVDADHGYGNALSVRRTVQELESAGAAGLSIEDTVLPQPYGQDKPQLISLEEGVGKMRAAVAARRDPTLAIFARTAASITSVDDAINRARAYEATGVDALFVVGIKKRAELEAFAKATRLPIMLGTVEAEIDDLGYLASQRVRIANQGHLPFAAAAQAVYATLKALREGTAPKDIKGLPSSDLMNRWSRTAEATERQTNFLGIKPKS
jgi:carboxyvinyl-carboxyphosphonate phosphorylmutase